MSEGAYTPEQVAEKLQVSPQTIVRLIKQQKMSAIKVGKQWRITESAYREFLERSKDGR